MINPDDFEDKDKKDSEDDNNNDTNIDEVHINEHDTDVISDDNSSDNLTTIFPFALS